MKTNVGLKFLVTALLGFTLSGCGDSSGGIDYSESVNWLALPSQTDNKHEVDVFYVYPTAYTAGANGPLIGEIDDANMVAGARSAFQRQASAFETIGDIYAPFYRQADAVRVLSLPTTEAVEQVIGGVPTSDVTDAFDYYIRNYNNGRPFILVSHSQGSTVVALLLERYLKDRPLVYNRMIAAYAIGWSFTQDYFDRNPHLKFASAPDDTGVIISYNTQGPMFAQRNPVVFPGAMAINPITWTRGEELATARQNLGSLLLDEDGVPVTPIQATAMNFADAQITRIDAATSKVDPASDTEVVICSTVDPAKVEPHIILPWAGFYHSYDYPFYYENIRVNATSRTDKFLNRTVD